jgi:putative transposase
MEPLIPDTSFHIFNHANGFENVFRHEANYYFFMEKFWKYIDPIAETNAWCLMPNHLHLVVRFRKRTIIKNEYIFSKVSNSDQVIIIDRNEFNRTKKVNFGKDFDFDMVVSDSEIGKYLSKQFANLFSRYTQSFNKVYDCMESLFIKNFKPVPITDKVRFLNAVVYTHRNPIHHGFCKNYEDWPYSSYNDILQGNPSGIETTKLLKMTNGLNGFLQIHKRSLDTLDNKNDPAIPLPI